MIVLLLPPRAFCKSFVSTESLYGTRAFFLPIDKSASACQRDIRYNTRYAISIIQG